LTDPEPVISVVVPTFDRRASLDRLLRALDGQTLPRAQFEVIVVDDGSSDGTPEALGHAATTFELRALTQAHAGPAAARNLGVSQSHGQLIVFLDVPDPELLETHAAAYRESPDTVVVGPMLPPPDWRRPAWIRWEEEQLVAQYDAMLAGVYECTPRQLFTGNASLPRERFLSAGGFDPNFGRAEDVELGYRLERLGMRFRFQPDAKVWHYPQRTFTSWCRTPYQYGTADVRMQLEKGHPTLDQAYREFHGRHALNRLAVEVCIGRPTALRLMVALFKMVALAADRIKAPRAASPALSAVFNLLYWQGVTDALGDREPRIGDRNRLNHPAAVEEA